MTGRWLAILLSLSGLLSAFDSSILSPDLKLLQPFIENSILHSEEAIKLREAKDRYQFGFLQEALETLDSMKPERLQDWRAFYRGKVLFKMGRVEEAVREWLSIPRSSAVFYLSRREIVENVEDPQLKKSALLELEPFKARDYPFYLYYMGKLYNPTYLRYLYCNCPLSSYAEKVRPVRTPSCRLARAKAFLARGAYRKALKELRPLRGDRVNYYKAKAYFGLRKYSLAIKRLKLIRKKQPQDWLLLLRCYIRKDYRGKAEQVYLRIKKLYPNSRTQALALWYLARLYLPEEKGIELLEKFVQEHQGSAEWDEAVRRLFWLYYLKDKEKAFDLYRKYRGKIRNIYIGITLDYWFGKENDPQLIEELARNYPLTYYGLKSLKIIGVDFPRLKPPYFNVPQEPAFKRAFEKAQLLYSVNLLQEAKEELEHLRRLYPSSKLAKFAQGVVEYELGNSILGIRLMRTSVERSFLKGLIHPALLRRMYPLPFKQILLKLCRRNLVDPFLVAALIHQESAFLPTAKSVAGAIGLMQLMPYTHRAVAKRMGLNSASKEMLYDVLHNLRVGIYHLRELINLFSSEIKALAAYNAGVDAVKEWIENYTEDDELFVESIPYKQTRNYVKNIILKREIYRSLYGE